MSAVQSLRRTSGLARFNSLLMMRNRTTMLYAFLAPLLPLGLLFLPDRAERTAAGGAVTVGVVLLMALLFPGYYNLLSMFVTRRDELVLKRLRTGEVRDTELLVSMAVPGVVITVLVVLLAVPVTIFAGYQVRFDVMLLLVGVLLASAAFAALALWTASWTGSAESAQLTSSPVMLLAFAGFMGPFVPQPWRTFVEWLPGAAVEKIVRVGWFGRESAESTVVLSGGETWGAAFPALLVLLTWTVGAGLLAAASLRWEPRA